MVHGKEMQVMDFERYAAFFALSPQKHQRSLIAFYKMERPMEPSKRKLKQLASRKSWNSRKEEMLRKSALQLSRRT